MINNSDNDEELKKNLSEHKIEEELEATRRTTLNPKVGRDFRKLWPGILFVSRGSELDTSGLKGKHVCMHWVTTHKKHQRVYEW